MRGWLIYDRDAATENKTYIDWFIEEAFKQGVNLALIIRDSLTIGIINGKYQVSIDDEITNLPDFAIIRTIEPALQAYFEACDIPAFNSFAIAHTCNNKALTHIELNKLDIPMVPTFFAPKNSLPDEPPISYPFIVKEASGRSGRQVYLIQNEQDWTETVASLSGNEILIQDANVQLGKDVRVFVIGKKIIGAVLRVNDNDFRANYKLGGYAVPYNLTESDESIVRKIIDCFDFGLVGIDFLLDKSGALLFNEIEDVVGSRTLSAVSEINLLEKYVAFIKKIVEKRKGLSGRQENR